MSIRPARSSLDSPAESRQIALTPVTAADRARARLQVMLAGRDLQERRDLLAALGLDNPDEITAQLAHRRRGAQP